MAGFEWCQLSKYNKGYLPNKRNADMPHKARGKAGKTGKPKRGVRVKTNKANKGKRK